MNELKIEHLTKDYGTVKALDDFSITFTPGIYGILGANGAGKSTLMNLITDNVKRQTGTILYNGEDILKLGKAFRAVLGYMPQQQGFYEDMSAYAFLRYIASLKGLKRKEAKAQIESLLEVVSLTVHRHKKVGGFSGGMKQRLLLCATLLGKPEVLILDEPTAGLDPKERISLRNYIARLSEDKIILIATHVVSDIETIAKEVLLLKDGKLTACATPQGLMTEIGKEGEAVDLESVYMYYFGDEQEDALEDTPVLH